MVVVGGGWVVLSLQSPLLYGCCGRWLGCIKSSVTSAVWLLWEVVGLYQVFTRLCCMVVVGGGWVVLSLQSPLLYGCCGRWLGCIKSSVTSAVWLLWEVVGLY